MCCSHFLHADSIHDAKVVVAVAALIPLSMEWSIPMDVVCPFGEKVLQFCVLRNTAKLNNDTFLAMFWFYSLWPSSHPSVVLSSLTGCWLAGWSGAPLAGVGACQLRLLLVIEATAEARSELNRTRSVSLRHPTTKLPALFYRLSLGEGKERWKNGSDLISIQPASSRAKVQYNRIDFESNAIRSN